MNSLAPDPLSFYKVGKNGLKTAFLKHPEGLSTVGAIMSIGAKNGVQSGETFLTLQSKLLDAIGSPQKAFIDGISTTFDVRKEYSMVLFQFLKESAKPARAILDQFFSPAAPSSASIAIARSQLFRQEELGNLTPELKSESVAAAASFPQKSYSIDALSGLSTVHINQSLINSLSSHSILIGSSDMETPLSSLADNLRTDRKLPPSEICHFMPGTCIRAPTGVNFSGSKLVKHPSMQHVAVSFPAVSMEDKDFFAFRILQKIFGGGSYFSSEGLGVGSYSLLYEDVLSKSNCESVFCHYWPYQKAGLLSFVVEAPSFEIPKIYSRIKDCMAKATKTNERGIEAAKEQAVISALKQLDQSANRFIEFGVEVQNLGNAKSPRSIISSIRGVKEDDVLRCAKKLLEVKPSVGIIGSVDPKEIQAIWK